MQIWPPTFKNPRWRTAAILKNGKSAVEQYLLMRRIVHVKSAIHRVGKSRIICYVIYFTYFTRPMSEINVIASFCALNLPINFECIRASVNASYCTKPQDGGCLFLNKMNEFDGLL